MLFRSVRYRGDQKIVENPKPEPVKEPKYTQPMRMSDGTYQQFEDGKIPPGAKFYVEPKAPKEPKEPEKPSVWLTKDGQDRFVSATEASQLVAQGWKKPTGESKPASGVEKRALNFYNRAQQADQDLENMEGRIAQMGLVECNVIQGFHSFPSMYPLPLVSRYTDTILYPITLALGCLG